MSADLRFVAELNHSAMSRTAAPALPRFTLVYDPSWQRTGTVINSAAGFGDYDRNDWVMVQFGVHALRKRITSLTVLSGCGDYAAAIGEADELHDIEMQVYEINCAVNSAMMQARETARAAAFGRFPIDCDHNYRAEDRCSHCRSVTCRGVPEGFEARFYCENYDVEFSDPYAAEPWRLMPDYDHADLD